MHYEPVTHTTTERRVGTRPSGNPITVTVHRYSGGDGPRAYVQAAQHGIELNGPATLRRLHERLLGADIAGTVVAVPVVNPLAFDHRSYVTPPSYDALNANLNRSWPGDDAGTFQERVADNLWSLVDDADAVVDLHTGTADMLAHVRALDGDDAARTLAERFGLSLLLLDRPPAVDNGTAGGAGDASGTPRRGKFRNAAAARGIPAITAELANSRTVSRSAVEAGVEGLVNVLRELDVLEASPSTPPDQSVFYDDADPLLASSSGLFEPRPDVRVGDRVEAGDELGVVYSPSAFGRLETVIAHESGLVYSLAREAVVVEGERLASIAVPE